MIYKGKFGALYYCAISFMLLLFVGDIIFSILSNMILALIIILVVLILLITLFLLQTLSYVRFDEEYLFVKLWGFYKLTIPYSSIYKLDSDRMNYSLLSIGKADKCINIYYNKMHSISVNLKNMDDFKKELAKRIDI